MGYQVTTLFFFFREVPKLGQLLIMRLLFVEQPVPKAVTTSWVDTTHAK